MTTIRHFFELTRIAEIPMSIIYELLSLSKISQRSLHLLILSTIFLSLTLLMPISIRAAAPGGVETSMELWLKAEAGIHKTDGQLVSQWENQANRDYTVLQSKSALQPIYYSTTNHYLINFNPTLAFQNDFLENATRLFDYKSAFHAFVVAEDRETNLKRIRAPLSIGNYGNYPGFDLQTSSKSPAGWYPFMMGSLPKRTWRGSHTTNRLFNNNTGGPNQQPQIFALSSSNESTKAKDNIFSYIDGYKERTTLEARQLPKIGNRIYIGSSSHLKKEAWNGLIAEVIIYSKQLSDNEIQRVHSYLAIKYGITLDQSVKYVASDDNTVIYPTTETHPEYVHDIAGIGRDDASALEQLQSKSVNEDAIMTIAHHQPFNTDLSFLVWGNNNAQLNIDPKTARMPRIWQVAKTGTVETVTLSADLSQVEGLNDINQVTLLTDTNPQFQAAKMFTVSRVNQQQKVVEFQKVNLDDGQYFTLGHLNQPPILGIIGTQLAIVGETITFLATATDKENNTLVFSLEKGPKEAKIDSQSGAFSWTPTQAGFFSLTVKVTETDGKPTNLSDSETLTIMVNEKSSVTHQQALESTNPPIEQTMKLTKTFNSVAKNDEIVTVVEKPTIPLTKPNRYIDNADGTITDTTTSLVWLKKANCIGSEYPDFDKDCPVGDGKVSWPHAQDFIDALNAGQFPKCSDGYNDWRLPTVQELESLVNYDLHHPAMSPNVFSNVISDNYWTSTLDASNHNFAWRVRFDHGLVFTEEKSHPFYVWPVRGQQCPEK
jgi:hypothetical protein